MCYYRIFYVNYGIQLQAVPYHFIVSPANAGAVVLALQGAELAVALEPDSLASPTTVLLTASNALLATFCAVRESICAPIHESESS